MKFSFDLEPLKCSIMSFGSGGKVDVTTFVVFVSGYKLFTVYFCLPAVYHPQTSYSSRSRCSSTSSSVTGSTSVKAPPTSEVQHQPSAYIGRPNVPHKQVFIELSHNTHIINPSNIVCWGGLGLGERHPCLNSHEVISDPDWSAIFTFTPL